MKKFVGILGLLVCLGQGCPAPQTTVPERDRLAVDDELRSACNATFGGSDVQIKAALVAVDADRANGFNREQELAHLYHGCQTDDLSITGPCQTCSLILVDHIYGQ